jgi:dolichol-phosphate mannosyltransferase
MELLVKLFVVLPVYNEESCLPELLKRLDEVRSATPAMRLIVVDDGSTDGSVSIVRRQPVPVDMLLHEFNLGLGDTIQHGLRRAAERADPEDVIVTMDADNTQPPEIIPQMIREVEGGSDVVIASRYEPGARVQGLSAFRTLMSVGARVTFQLAFRVPNVRDYTSGFRAYRAAVVQQAMEAYGDRLVTERGFACMAEILLKLHATGARMSEVPMVLRYDLKGGASKMNVPLTVWKTLRLISRTRRISAEQPQRTQPAEPSRSTHQG